MLRLFGMILLMMFMSSSVNAEDASVASPLTMKALREQMAIERGKEEELQLLQFEVERLKLEVEKKKAATELGKIPEPGHENGVSATSDAQPAVVLRYLFMSAERKEAVFDVDGTPHRLQEGQEVGGQRIKNISADGVSLQGKDGIESFLRPGA
jgi:hypothetical protein